MKSSYEFKRGYPTAKAAQTSNDDTDLSRAVRAYRFYDDTRQASWSPCGAVTRCGECA
jgi:hypothetical protein